MVSLIILSLFQFGVFSDPPLGAVHKILSRDIQLYTGTPPVADSLVNCFHFSDLLKVSVDKRSKVVSIIVSDGSSEWMKGEVKRMLQKKEFRIEKLDSIFIKNKISSVDLLIPVFIESDDFPCGSEKKARKIQPYYFNFNGTLLKGNVIFMKEIEIVLPTKHVF